MKKSGKEDYSTFDAIRILGLKRDRLKDWIMQGFIVPTHQEKVARGMKSYFDRWGLYMISLFHYLVTHGIVRDQAAKWIMELTEHKKLMEKESSELRASKADYVIIKRKNDEIMQGSITWGKFEVSPKEDVDDMFIIKFSNIVKSVDMAIEKANQK